MRRQLLLAASSGALLAACSSSSPPLSRQVADWARSAGLESGLSTVRSDLAHIDAMAGTVGAALRTACDVLVTDTLSANQQLPSPDHLLTTLLEGAYTAAGNAGHDCFSGAGGDGALLARSATERAQARTDLIKAEARYDALVSAVPGRTS